jgi:hypothetical protein
MNLADEIVGGFRGLADALKASCAAFESRVMRWPAPGVDSTPTEPGWYRLRNGAHNHGEKINDGIYLIEMRNNHLSVWDGRCWAWHASNIRGEWVRIPFPLEPEAANDAK